MSNPNGRVGRLLTVDEAARRLNLAARTVRRMLRRGELKGGKTSPGRAGVWRVSEDELERWSQPE